MPIAINKNKLRCPRCNSPMKVCKAVSGSPSKNWVECTSHICPTYINCYIPLYHQAVIHSDPARYKILAGGYGSGKTEADNQESQKHIMITEGGRTLFGAPVYNQLKPTLKKDFENDWPAAFVRRESKQEAILEMVNSHELLYRSFDDPHKLRSLNLSAARILEASGTKYSTFTQLMNRLRNDAALLYEYDEEGDVVYDFDEKMNEWRPRVLANWLSISMETNPDPGWVNTKGLLESNRIYLYGDSTKDQQYEVENPVMNLSTHIIPTESNIYLPPNFEEEQCSGKPEWWRQRYFKGSFLYAEGMVYPNFMNAIVDDFDVPRTWKRIIAMDYGIRDATHFVFIAIDDKNHIAYAYDELRITDADIKTISQRYKEKLRNIPPTSLLRTPVMDGISRNKRLATDVEKRLHHLFEDEGLLFDPAQMNLDARILQVNTLINLGQLKFFKYGVRELIREGKDYKFPERELDKHKKTDDKPIDKNNHGMNALEFGCMELPRNLELFDFTAYNRLGQSTALAPGATLAEMIEKANPFTGKKKSNRYDPFMGGDTDDGMGYFGNTHNSDDLFNGFKNWS